MIFKGEGDRITALNPEEKMAGPKFSQNKRQHRTIDPLIE